MHTNHFILSRQKC